MPRRSKRNYKKIAAKRKATLIEKYGSWEAYREYQTTAYKQAMLTRLGPDGYKDFQRSNGIKGGKASRRTPAPARS